MITPRVPVRRVLIAAATLIVALMICLTMTSAAWGAAKTMRIRVLNATTVPLIVADKTLDKGHWRGSGPQNASPLHIADQTIESENLAFKGDTRWWIGNVGGYKLKVWGTDGPKSNCAIQNAQNQATDQSPYKCVQDLKGGADSDQYTVVEPKNASTTTLIAGQRRREVFETLCGTNSVDEFSKNVPNFAKCKIDMRDLKTAADDAQSKAAGDILANCGASKPEIEDSWIDTTTQTNNIGGSIGVGYKAPTGVFEAKVEATWSFSWISTRTWSDGRTLSLDPNTDKYAWFETAPYVRRAKADVLVTVGDQKFELPDVVVKAPLKTGAMGAFARGADRPNTAGLCSGHSTSAVAREIPPDVLDPEQVYTLGLNNFNRRVITVPDDNHSSGSRLRLGQLDDKPGQRWQLKTVTGHPGYYQIHSDNDLDLCIDQHVAAATAEQYPCKKPEDGSLANHLWKLKYNDANRDLFQLESKENGKVIGARGTSAGDELVMVNANAGDVNTWWQVDDICAACGESGSQAQSGVRAAHAHRVRARPPTPVAHAGVTRTIRFRILNGTDRKLELTSKSTGGTGSWRETPTNIEPMRTDDFTVTSGSSPSGELKYKIAGTTSTAYVLAVNPLVGNNRKECTATGAYSCQIGEDKASYNDTNIFVVVQPKDAATHTISGNGAERARAMEAACGANGETEFAKCGVRDVQNVSYGLAPATPVGHVIANCGTTGTSAGSFRETSKTTGHSWSVGVSTEFKFGKVYQLTIKAFYNHGWTVTHTDKTKIRQSVPPGYYGWMDLAPPVTNIRADYTIKLGNQTYEIPSVTATIPGMGEVDTPLVIGRTRAISDPAKTCANRGEPFDLPAMIAPTIGGIYRIGLRDNNRRVISAGAGATDIELKLASYDTGDLNQAWEFDELPGHPGDFLIRNAANPLLCLDQKVSVHQLIVYSCKTGSEADVANQLWSANYDPTTNTYTLVSKVNGEGAVASDTKSGSTVATAAQPSDTLGRWEFLLEGE